MAITNTVPEVREYDVIIAGGGTAGCVVAGRLAAADPELSILVVESGRDNAGMPTIKNPFLLFSNLDPATKTALFFTGGKCDRVGGREVVVPCGNVLGGGSSINFMMYTRPLRMDFESWKTPGWGPDEMMPLLKRIETYHGRGDPSIHGHSGPMTITDGTNRCEKLCTQYMAAAAYLGYPEVVDNEDMQTTNTVSRHLRFIDHKGDRVDAATAYLRPLLNDGKHPNLHVLTEHNVVRVLFDNNKQANGVEITPNPLFQTDATGQKITVHARKQVIVSAGALSSPGILERSGIGSQEILKKARVPVVVDLPGVGNDLQDHHSLLIPYRSSLQPQEALNDVMKVTPENMHEWIEQMDKDGRRGWNGLDVSGKLRPSEADVESLGEVFKSKWDMDFRDTGRPLVQFNSSPSFPGPPPDPPCEMMTLVGFTLYPYSRGAVHITGPDTTDRVDFTTGFLTDPDEFDVRMLRWTYKKQREIARRMPIYRGEVAYAHPIFPAGSKAAVEDFTLDGTPPLEAAGGVMDGVKNLEYSADDDAAIDAYVRTVVGTTWHSLGTARMAPRDTDGRPGVVDASLNVYGVSGLKVCDLSIVPENVGANTTMTALVVGEKCADIVARELGLV